MYGGPERLAREYVRTLSKDAWLVTPGGGNPPFLTTVLSSTGRGSVRFPRFDEGFMRPVHALFDGARAVPHATFDTAEVGRVSMGTRSHLDHRKLGALHGRDAFLNESWRPGRRH